jgi:hypothetical protein
MAIRWRDLLQTTRTSGAFVPLIKWMTMHQGWVVVVMWDTLHEGWRLRRSQYATNGDLKAKASSIRSVPIYIASSSSSLVCRYGWRMRMRKRSAEYFVGERHPYKPRLAKTSLTMKKHGSISVRYLHFFTIITIIEPDIVLLIEFWMKLEVTSHHLNWGSQTKSTVEAVGFPSDETTLASRTNAKQNHQ